jgi:hypothetical protein
MESEGSRKKDKHAVVVEAATVNLWPDAGQALGLKRNSTYDAAARGQIPVIQFGRLKKVSKKVLARLLDPGAAA